MIRDYLTNILYVTDKADCGKSLEHYEKIRKVNE